MAKESKKKEPKLKHPCPGGSGFDRKLGLPPHEIRYQSKYDDPSRNLRGIKLTYTEARAAYTCRRCKAWMGCAVCIDDVVGLVCKNCRDWANDISERVHGPMLKDDELKIEGMRLVQMVSDGKISVEEHKKLWAEAQRAATATA